VKKLQGKNPQNVLQPLCVDFSLVLLKQQKKNTAAFKEKQI